MGVPLTAVRDLCLFAPFSPNLANQTEVILARNATFSEIQDGGLAEV